MASFEIDIRRIAAGDRPAWDELWAGYLAFYEKRLSSAVTERTWARLVSDRSDATVFGLLAVGPSGQAVGLVHYLYHPSTWSVGGVCYLEDLFVAPSARGHGVGRRLIAAVAAAARAQGASAVYWQTEEFNGTARRLYERIAKRSPFARYEIEL